MKGVALNAADLKDRKKHRKLDRRLFYLPQAGAEAYAHSRLSDPANFDDGFGLDTVLDQDSATFVAELSTLFDEFADHRRSDSEFQRRSNGIFRRYSLGSAKHDKTGTTASS